QPAKPAREVAPGDMVRVRKGDTVFHVRVVALSNVRGPAPVAQQLYEETADSIAAREAAAEARRYAPEPAHTIREGRPTKRERGGAASPARGPLAGAGPQRYLGAPTEGGPVRHPSCENGRRGARVGPADVCIARRTTYAGIAGSRFALGESCGFTHTRVGRR